MFSLAGIKTVILSVNVPVSSITLLEDSAVAEALAVVSVTSALPATDLDKYPAAKASRTSRLLLVLSPQVPAFSPVPLVLNPNLKMLMPY